jgi:hypothetical protein
MSEKTTAKVGSAGFSDAVFNNECPKCEYKTNSWAHVYHKLMVSGQLKHYANAYKYYCSACSHEWIDNFGDTQNTEGEFH